MSLCQAVFPQTDGLEGDGSAEAQYAYYPATIAEATSGTMVTTVQASDTLLGQTTPTGDAVPVPEPWLSGSFSPGVCLCHHRPGLRDDVAPGGADGLQPEDHRPPDPALHRVISARRR